MLLPAAGVVQIVTGKLRQAAIDATFRSFVITRDLPQAAYHPATVPRLSTQILLLQLAIIALTVGVATGVMWHHERTNLQKRAGAQSLAIARGR